MLFTSDPDRRRIGSTVSFFNITDIISEKDKDSGLYKIILQIKFRKDIHKTKEFFIDNENYKDLMEQFKEIIKEYDISCNIYS